MNLTSITFKYDSSAPCDVSEEKTSGTQGNGRDVSLDVKIVSSNVIHV